MFIKKYRNLLSICCEPTDVPLDKRHYFDFGTFLFGSPGFLFTGLEREILPDELMVLLFDLPDLSDDSFFEDKPSTGLPFSFLPFLSTLDERDVEWGDDGVRALF